MNKDDLAYRFVGGADGEFLMGVPARDLSQADVELLTPEGREALMDHMRRHGGLYATPATSARRRDSGKEATSETTEPVNATQAVKETGNG